MYASCLDYWENNTRFICLFCRKPFLILSSRKSHSFLSAYTALSISHSRNTRFHLFCLLMPLLLLQVQCADPASFAPMNLVESQAPLQICEGSHLVLGPIILPLLAVNISLLSLSRDELEGHEEKVCRGARSPPEMLASCRSMCSSVVCSASSPSAWASATQEEVTVGVPAAWFG